MATTCRKRSDGAFRVWGTVKHEGANRAAAVSHPADRKRERDQLVQICYDDSNRQIRGFNALWGLHSTISLEDWLSGIENPAGARIENVLLCHAAPPRRSEVGRSIERAPSQPSKVRVRQVDHSRSE
ncbi:hypothetical protein CALCODRAFT_507254 [Calocera cornea HHB12733]|uniref:Uncharacterized protein n=1 Tax=Calocera cornea HHB12733 TaxID=1353952 RepID=A0A165HYA5_9BASI|nr:hypothetical protein CALCODRAFT_507254 [Calocera cornea HHB12733]